MTAKRYLVVAIPLMVVEWIFFKWRYPAADLFVDSYSYLDAAAQGLAISYRPIGYSLFLRAVHLLSHSDIFLTTLQYVLVQGASLGLFGMLVKRCGLSGIAAPIVMAFLVLDPAIPYLCNFVSSDALFMALSLIWITLVMGMIREPSWWRLCLQAVLLLAIVNLRYAALFYPAVSALSFLLIRKKASAGFKLAGIAVSVGIVLACTVWIKHITYKKTGADVFSAFSGWQIAGNALNLYPFIPVDTTGLPTPECSELAADAANYFAKEGPALRARGPYATTDYLWLPNSPLNVYLIAFQNREKISYFNAWNRVAPLFSRYGYSVIRRHPAAFLRYYLWPSTKTFFVPPLGEFEVHKRALSPVPRIYLLFNAAFVMTTLLFLFSRRCREGNPIFMTCLELASAYLLSNACFAIFASPSVLRYQILTMTLLFVFTVSAIYLLTFQHGFPFIARDRRH